MMEGIREKRNNLVIVRAGSRSLHHDWLDQPYEQRSFDLLVSFFDAEAFSVHRAEAGVFAVFNPGGKWDGLHQALEWLGDDLDRYDYVWLPDDDIETSSASINKIFYLMERYDLAVAQPSLTQDSFFTHFLFINCPGLTIRWTNFVEIMVPCLSRSLLKSVRHHFDGSMSGFGLDYIWCRLADAGIGRAAILDSVSVKHTRPVGNVLMATIARSGIDPKEEEAQLNACYGITKRITPLAYKAVTRRGWQSNGKVWTGLLMACCHAFSLCTERKGVRHYGASRVIQLFRRQITRKLDLSIVSAQPSGSELRRPAVTHSSPAATAVPIRKDASIG